LEKIVVFVCISRPFDALSDFNQRIQAHYHGHCAGN
jgi:hypothetical protein